MCAGKKELRASRGVGRCVERACAVGPRASFKPFSSRRERRMEEPSAELGVGCLANLFSNRNNYRNYYTHQRMIFQCFSATISKRSKLFSRAPLRGDILCWRTNRTASRTHVETSRMRRPEAELRSCRIRNATVCLAKGTHEQRSRVKPARLGHRLVRGGCFARGSSPLAA